jgi:hypothetical protein
MALESFKQFTDIVEDVFQANAFDFQNQFTSRMGGEIAKRTPIKTGLAKGNWQADENPIARPRANVEDKSKTGTKAQKKMYKSLDVGRFKSGRTVYVKNAVDSKDNRERINNDGGGYIIKLEEGGSPRQAPDGMFYIALAQSKRISKQALKAAVTKP